MSSREEGRSPRKKTDDEVTGFVMKPNSVDDERSERCGEEILSLNSRVRKRGNR